jgi:hypothetical protein
MRQRHDFHGYGYRIRIPSNPWVLLLAVGLAVVAGGTLLALLAALLAVAATGALLFGGAWLAWQGTRALVAERRPAPNRRLSREARGLIEMAATPDPLEQYLIAVREFERLSAAALEIDPQSAGRRSASRRAWELADQTHNLYDAVNDIERALVSDPNADGARAHIWELSHAVREVYHYLSQVHAIRHTPTLADLRGLITARTALSTRRTALVGRLDAVQVTRTINAPIGG